MNIVMSGTVNSAHGVTPAGHGVRGDESGIML